MDIRSGQVRSGQVRSGQVRSGQNRTEQNRTDSLLIEIITPLVTPGAIQKSCQIDRDGA